MKITRSLTPVLKRIEEKVDYAKVRFLELFVEALVSYSPVDTGAYVLSHTVTTSSNRGRGYSSRNRPTGQSTAAMHGEALSQLYADIQAVEGSDKIAVNNRSPHNKAVEFGGHNWKRGGYYPYTRARAMIPTLLSQAIRETKPK